MPCEGRVRLGLRGTFPQQALVYLQDSYSLRSASALLAVFDCASAHLADMMELAQKTVVASMPRSKKQWGRVRYGHIRGSLVVLSVAFVVLLGAALAGCGRRLALKVVDAESVPPAIRDEVVVPGKLDLVWHAAGEGEGYAFAACTYQAYGADGKLGPCWEVAIALQGGDGTTRVLTDGFRPMPAKSTYLSWRGSGKRSVDGGSVYFIQSGGLALTASAVQVVGVTTAGKRQECPVKDGCWALALEGVAEGEYWSEVVALDAGAKILHKYHEDWKHGMWVR